MHVEITEIIKRSDQGNTKPFLCQASDGKTYYVKGREATTVGLIKEWIGTQLAESYGLPVPKSKILYVESNLVDAFGLEAQRGLGSGYVFGSERISAVTELKYEQVGSIKATLKRDILLFDLWICNEDRTLSKYGGNPNLLWNTNESELCVIDHNLAFDNNFKEEEFWATHVFKDEIFNDLVDRANYQEKMKKSLEIWSKAWEIAPEDWLEENNSININLEFDKLLADAEGSIWTRLT